MVKAGGALILTRLTSERLGHVAGISKQSARKILMLSMQTPKTTTTTPRTTTPTPRTTNTTTKRKTPHRAAALTRGERPPKKRGRQNPGRPRRRAPRRLNARPVKLPRLAQLRAHLMRGCKPVPLPSPRAVRVANRQSQLALNQVAAERRTPKSSSGRGDGEPARGSKILRSLQQLRGRLRRQDVSSSSSSSSGEESHDNAPAPPPTPNATPRRSSPRTRLDRTRGTPNVSRRTSSELDVSSRSTPTSAKIRSQRHLAPPTVVDLSLVPVAERRPLSQEQASSALQTHPANRARTRQPSHVRRCSQCRRQTGQWTRQQELEKLREEEEEEEDSWLTPKGRMSIYCSREPCIVQ